ncbi:IS200/IS605 family element transposase accessory protein TnpB [Moritella sp. 36]|uniref:RNA-guided endonuclease TnpB family protein n=1 Tax=Moritella sp. 36 TaxID=2746233 RepID=UPI001BA87BA2|nr:RNA-guided endonuclease TnpB family protein [Moritella sp. 36]QUM87958.1 IS200/IS605 family element transposase accessory protein TnpB [Moritella sp. 36]
MLRATKVRIYPTADQAEFLNAQFGAVRFAYNKALHIKKHFYSVKGISLAVQKDLKPLLAKGKKSRKYSWLKQYDSIALQQAVINLDGAYKRFFDKKLKAGFPTFKRKHGKQSSYHCTSVKATDNTIKIPKLSAIKARIHRELVGTLKSITISKSVSGKYFASLLVKSDEAIPVKSKHITSVSGYYLGLTHYLIDDRGNKTANPRFLVNACSNLRKKQKALSRTKKGSRNRSKARLKLASAHERVSNARNDFQHKLSKRIIDDNQAVIVETLKSSNMLKNRKLSRHISDASWSGFVDKVSYKAEMYGVHLVKCNQWFASSKTCSCCGDKVKDMPLNIRHWSCPSCNTQHDRDINASKNIRHYGIIKLKADGLTVSA